MDNSMPGGKRDNPNYAQLSGHVPKEKKRRFEIYCVNNDVTLSEGLEIALDLLHEKSSENDTNERDQQNRPA